jgi:hypothetical protein
MTQRTIDLQVWSAINDTVQLLDVGVTATEGTTENPIWIYNRPDLVRGLKQGMKVSLTIEFEGDDK